MRRPLTSWVVILKLNSSILRKKKEKKNAPFILSVFTTTSSLYYNAFMVYIHVFILYLYIYIFLIPTYDYISN